MQPELPSDEDSPTLITQASQASAISPAGGASQGAGQAFAVRERPEGGPVPPRRARAAAISARWPLRGRSRLGVIIVVLLVGLVGLAVSAAGVAGQLLPRKFSAAQQQQIMTWQTARRWLIRPAGQIFPATLSYQLPGYSLASGSGLTLTAQRIGIAKQASCHAATDPAAAQVLDARGCAAVIRATYVDSTGSMVVTVGVAVLPSTAAADAAASKLSHGQGLGAGVRAVAFGGTLAASFGDPQRQLSWAGNVGPYLVMSTAGYTDGMPHVSLASDSYAAQEMTSVANGVADAVVLPLGAQPPTPRCPGSPGC
jgi:hypothetical protein